MTRANRLAGETSPYLLQHAHNPVDWHPWGAEALERARREDRPIFLSIGYAACHWCHVMERESFESTAVADFLNRHFVSIKVDREERPDLDQIYMNAVQMLTGTGGWPLSVFLTPSLEPFHGGTYFPPEDRYGRIGFLSLLERIHTAWATRRADIDDAARSMHRELERLAGAAAPSEPRASVGRAEIAGALGSLAGHYDASFGGFSAAPKFPPDGAIDLLLRESVRGGETMPRTMALHTLERMALGGLYDHVGGGFSRYSVDDHWLVPHFEKMLYNQALLVPLYVDAWRLSGRALFRRVAEESLDFVRRELRDPAGGFHSSLDADSEGSEGAFYVWSPEEVRSILGDEDGRWFCERYGIDAAGNFEGRSIPHLLSGGLERQAEAAGASPPSWVERVAPLRQRLLEARQGRVRPATDDKVLTAWNGLMISAYALAHQVLERPADLDSAQEAAEFLARTMLDDDGRLAVTYRDGVVKLNGYLDDYAFYARGLVDLYEACFDGGYLRTAERLVDTALARFEDPERGGFFFTSDDHEPLLTRNRSHHDGAIPSGAGVLTEVLARLGWHLGRDDYHAAARRSLQAYVGMVRQAPSAFTSLLRAADFAASPLQVAISGPAGDPRADALVDVVRRRVLPGLVVAGPAPAGVRATSALLADRPPGGDGPRAYVCRGDHCEAPVSETTALETQLERS